MSMRAVGCCPFAFANNADGLAMPDIEHWASDTKAMAGSDQTDVMAALRKFVFVLSGWLFLFSLSIK